MFISQHHDRAEPSLQKSSTTDASLRREPGIGEGAHREVGEVVGEVRHVVEDVSEVPLGDLDVRGIGEAHGGGGVAEGAEVGVRVAGDPHARRGEGQRRLRSRLVGGAARFLLILPRIFLLVVVVAVLLLAVLRRQDDVRRHPGGIPRSRGEHFGGCASGGLINIGGKEEGKMGQCFKAVRHSQVLRF
jgi:hypothetical protein